MLGIFCRQMANSGTREAGGIGCVELYPMLRTEIFVAVVVS